jgi:hypothetical protein
MKRIITNLPRKTAMHANLMPFGKGMLDIVSAAAQAFNKNSSTVY